MNNTPFFFHSQHFNYIALAPVPLQMHADVSQGKELDSTLKHLYEYFCVT